MFSVRKMAAKQLLSKNTYSMGFGKKRKPTPNDLEKYDVVVIGAGLGNVLATHLDAVVGEKYKIFIAYDNPTTFFAPERNLYEQGSISKFNYSTPTRQIVSKNIAQSDYMGVEKIDPSANQVTLRNGRVIKYENLVVAVGQKDNYQHIKGFEDAWSDTLHPFYTNQDHSSWKSSVNKSSRVHLNFNGGPAIFYIPPGTSHGEVQDFNFMVSKGYWDLHAKTGKICWATSDLTVINPNKKFSAHIPRLDAFIQDICHKNNIDIEDDLTLVEIKKNQSVAVFKHDGTGTLFERPYSHFYTLMPTIANPLLAQAGLADSTGFLNVDPETLQHKTYNNIFGVGDALNVPTTRSFYGGLAQVAVVRNNVERRLNGLSLNAKYDGYSKVDFAISPSAIANIEHKYGGKEISFSTDGFSSALRFSLYNMKGKHNAENIYKFKNWGPPYYKWKKTFQGGETAAASAPVDLTPEKKTA